MTHPPGVVNGKGPKLGFVRCPMLPFRGSVVTADAGLRVYLELDDALGLSAIAGNKFADVRVGEKRSEAETSRYLRDGGFVACQTTVEQPKCRRS